MLRELNVQNPNQTTLDPIAVSAQKGPAFPWQRHIRSLLAIVWQPSWKGADDADTIIVVMATELG